MLVSIWVSPSARFVPAKELQADAPERKYPEALFPEMVRDFLIGEPHSGGERLRIS